MKLPELTGQPVLWVDGTPNEGYPLRILRAYRQQCDRLWADTTDGKGKENPPLKLMNEHQAQRAAILDRAIARLEYHAQIDRGGIP